MIGSHAESIAPINGVSVVVPVFRSTQSLPILVERIHSALSVFDHEIVLVDDGSPPQTWKTIKSICESDDRVVGLRLGRNAGQHSALLAGLRTCRFEVIATLDDDLQNPPEEIQKLIARLLEGSDVVYGVPRQVAQRAWRRHSGQAARKVFASVLEASNISHASSFRVFRAGLRDGFGGALGPGVSLDSLLSWSTSRFGWVEVEHHERANGKSNYSLRKLLGFALDTATGYSAKPLKLALLLGFFTAGFGALVMIFVVAQAIFSGEAVPGFAFLSSIISLFSGVQLLTIGIIGEYLAKMHFRIMQKPTYVVAERTGP